MRQLSHRFYCAGKFESQRFRLLICAQTALPRILFQRQGHSGGFIGLERQAWSGLPWNSAQDKILNSGYPGCALLRLATAHPKVYNDRQN